MNIKQLKTEFEELVPKLKAMDEKSNYRKYFHSHMTDYSDNQDDEDAQATAIYNLKEIIANVKARLITQELKESYSPMQLLKEMLIGEAEKPKLKKAAKSVYHRDYLRSKNKVYRKYDSDKYEQEKKA
jgi:hypothetical protein